MKQDRKLRLLYTHAYDFLSAIIGEEALEQKLNHYRYHRVDNMEDGFWYLINSLTNKSGMRATIGDIDALGPFIFCFDPWKTNTHYQDDWKKLFVVIQDNHTPPGPMNINKPNSYWAIFCKGILSGAEFLSRFDSFESLDQFINGFSHNDISIAALPIILDQEIYGMGFPLACDWLKEIGYINYGKPDTHTIDILYETGVAPSADNYMIFKTMVRMARVNNEPPSVIDRLLWLIGSGKYVGENEKVTRQKKAFIQEITPILDAV